jgi:hypothetical protein
MARPDDPPAEDPRPDDPDEDRPADPADTTLGAQDPALEEVRRRLDEEPEVVREAKEQRDAPDTDVTDEGESEPPA